MPAFRALKVVRNQWKFSMPLSYAILIAQESKTKYLNCFYWTIGLMSQSLQEGYGTCIHPKKQTHFYIPITLTPRYENVRSLKTLLI